LLVEALERYHHFYGDDIRIECPTGSGQWMSLFDVSQELRRRLALLFLQSADGGRPCHDNDPRYANDPHWRDLPLFYEYFHGDTGRGVGASHQTGWTALIATLMRDHDCHLDRASRKASVNAQSVVGGGAGESGLIGIADGDEQQRPIDCPV
jgi:hypothetical protein